MAVTIQDVENMAKLARLDLDPSEKETMRNELARMLDYVQKLNELDTESIPPTFFVQHASPVNREDQTIQSLSVSDALKNAPESAHGFFRVPKMIDSGGSTS
jgi:aspartyl-tRNA(Asn)/glutamyl-tRNA(Gln) amidotransferase subunit C